MRRGRKRREEKSAKEHTHKTDNGKQNRADKRSEEINEDKTREKIMKERTKREGEKTQFNVKGS